MIIVTFLRNVGIDREQVVQPRAFRHRAYRISMGAHIDYMKFQTDQGIRGTFDRSYMSS